MSTLAVTPRAIPIDPATLPLLQLGDVSYVGGFRLPAASSNGDTFSFGGRQLAYNAANNSLFIGARTGRIAEVSIPGLVYSTNPDALPSAAFLQGFSDPTEGRLSQIASEGVALDSLMVYRNRLYGSAFIYYDANNTQRVSHFSRSLTLNEPSFRGWSAVWQADKTGFVSGTMAAVPDAWQSVLGGPALTGQCCIPIVTRTSWGPAAFAFDPSAVGQAAVQATPLLYYTGEHSTLGSWDANNPTYGATMTMGGLVVVPGTRTALYFGAIGTGTNCYGNGTADRSLDLKIGPDGEKYCYDPTTSDKGSHAYPYRYQMWAYDLNDFAAVKAGTKQPWQVVPYGVWPFDLPTQATTVKLGGVGYDESTQTLYVSQLYADKDGYSYRPVIHALHLNAPDVHVAAPIDSVGLTSAQPAPQTVGTPIKFLAAANSNGTAQYKWRTFDGAKWTERTAWQSAEEFVETPSAANESFKVGVSARKFGSTNDAGEASAVVDYPITSARVTGVSIAASLVSPQATGTPIVWTATAVGGSAPQYKFQLFDGAIWKTVRDWSSSNTYPWTPAAAGSNYRVSVWARSGGSTDVYEAANEGYFVIAGVTAPPTPAPTPAPAGPVARISSVALGTSLASPQPSGTEITWIATAAGGVAPQYKFQMFDGQTWATVRDWSSANTYRWTPATAGSNYRVSVWARSTGSAEVYEAVNEGYYTITAPVVALRVTSVALGTNVPSPQVIGTPVTWIAAATGAASAQYKFQLFDGVNWVVARDWSSANTYQWTPAIAGANYRVSVWARAAGSTEVYEAVNEGYFTITSPVVSARVTSVALTANRLAPQAVNSTVTFTATPVGGAAPYQYQFWLFDGTTWASYPWTSSNTFSWTPTIAKSNYRISVWVKSAGNPEGIYEASTEVYFAINER